MVENFKMDGRNLMGRSQYKLEPQDNFWIIMKKQSAGFQCYVLRTYHLFAKIAANTPVGREVREVANTVKIYFYT